MTEVIWSRTRVHFPRRDLRSFVGAALSSCQEDGSKCSTVVVIILLTNIRLFLRKNKEFKKIKSGQNLCYTLMNRVVVLLQCMAHSSLALPQHRPHALSDFRSLSTIFRRHSTCDHLLSLYVLVVYTLATFCALYATVSSNIRLY